MNPFKNLSEQERQLYNSILDFELDEPESKFNFSERLTRENNWRLSYSLRVIFEYKRFMFLLCYSKQPLTPSNEVDEAWHLHLIYSYSYWEEFCGEVLKRKIHHGPTKGGKQESQKYDQLYRNTLDLYRQTFEQEPPPDIWPSVEKRFEFIELIKIDKKKYFVFKKWFSNK
jgi:hypothetical protein